MGYGIGGILITILVILAIIYFAKRIWRGAKAPTSLPSVQPPRWGRRWDRHQFVDRW